MAAIHSGLVGTAPLRYAVETGGQIYAVNGIDTPFVWDGVASSVRNWGIAAPPAPSAGATSGTGLTGVYYWQITWYNANTGEYGEPLALDLGPITLANQGYTVNRPSTGGIDSQITHWRLWRTTAGQSSTFYKVVDTLIATASYTDSIADHVILGNAVMSIINDIGVHNRPDKSKPFIKFYKGRFVLYGSRVENVGTVELTNGSTTVTGTGTNFRASHVGQRIYAGTDGAYYVIATVTSATAGTLTANYGGSSGSGKTFKIVPVRPSDVAWSQADSESFGVQSSTGVFPADGDYPTGIEVVGTSLILFKRSHAYMFDYGSNPNPLTGSGNLSLVLSSRGLARQECCISVGQTAFCLDAQGIYEFDGSSQEQPVDQAIRRLFHPDDEIPTAMRVNRTYIDTWHGTYDQRTDSVVFFVTTGTETTPQTALKWSRERQQWTIDKYDQGILASCQGRDSTGEYRAWVGDANDWIWALSGTRQAEGHSTGTIEGTATASTNSTLTDTLAAFTATNNKLKGVYVRVTSATTGVVQTRLITDNTATELTISPNWTLNPVAGATYVIGAIDTAWRSVWQFTEPNPSLQVGKVWLFWVPTAAGRSFKIRFFKDFESNPVLKWTVSGLKDGVTVTKYAATDGYITIDASFFKGRCQVNLEDNFHTCYAVEVAMVGANEPILVRGYDMQGIHTPDEFE